MGNSNIMLKKILTSCKIWGFGTSKTETKIVIHSNSTTNAPYRIFNLLSLIG